MMLDRDAILSRKQLKRETVDVPEWGGQVIVRELTGAERSRYEAGYSDTVMGEAKSVSDKTKRFETMRAKVICVATINEDGTRVFHDDDIAEINELSGQALDRLASVIMRLSGYTKEEQEKLKKNSEDPEPLNLH